jgi:hypothetical protein
LKLNNETGVILTSHIPLLKLIYVLTGFTGFQCFSQPMRLSLVRWFHFQLIIILCFSTIPADL